MRGVLCQIWSCECDLYGEQHEKKIDVILNLLPDWRVGICESKHKKTDKSNRETLLFNA